MIKPDDNQATRQAPESGGKAESLNRIKTGLLKHVAAIAKDCGATSVFVYVDAVVDGELDLPDLPEHRVFFVTRTDKQQKDAEDQGKNYLRVPNVPLTRMGQVKIAVFLALSRGLVHHGDTIVCLSGVAATGTLDTIVVTQVGRELEMFAAANEQQLPPHILPEVVERVIDMASELGNEGREGKPVGALFVVGDTEKVLSLSRQMILNPFRGYPEEERNLLDPGLEETVKELATIDGAFVIRGDGVIESCGAYLKTASQEEFELPRGLGGRHHAAAAITSLTESVAVTVSESTGTVTIFRGGKIMTEIEKPRSGVQGKELGHGRGGA